MMKKRNNTISASEMGRVAYCPRALSYQLQGIKRTYSAEQRINKGNARHHQFNQAIKANNGSQCYVASMCYGLHHPKTDFLRAYRDNVLACSTWGRMCIMSYYAVAPLLIVTAKVCQPLHLVMVKVLDLAVGKLHQESQQS
jgi:hypothetical protein